MFKDVSWVDLTILNQIGAPSIFLDVRVDNRHQLAPRRLVPGNGLEESCGQLWIQPLKHPIAYWLDQNELDAM